MQSRNFIRQSVGALLLSSVLTPVLAADALDVLSLEELTQTEVSSVARRSQSLANVPAAAFVISAEDIRRSGAYALPDVLRMVPGIEVAQVDNGRYAVSARGFNGRFANKLQVLVDGRSIYSPFFSGVMWEHDPVALDDIERIEVIRGPSAAMWGANAVNGVINIITRHSASQEGGLLAPTIGTNNFGQVYGRYAGRIDDRTSWKLSFQGRRQDPSTQYASDAESEDKQKNGQLNFRFDRNLGNGSDLSIWASALDSQLGDLALVNPEFTLFPPSVYLVPAKLKQTDDIQTITGRYRWLTGAVESSLQVSATRTHIEMEGWFHEDRETYDIDYQGRYATGNHDLLWGLSHRTNSDDSVSSAEVLALTKESFTQRSTGLFIHDDWTLIPERLQFGFGVRWETSNLGGSTIAPSATLMWTPSRMHSAWVKLARAPRVPARGEYHVSAITTFMPGTFPAVVIHNLPPMGELKPEKMTSLELGYRAQLSPDFNFNLTAYRQHYEDRVSGAFVGPNFSMLPFLLLQDFTIGNYSSGWINGIELAADWLVTPAWRLQLSLTATHLDMDGAATPEAAQDNAIQERRVPKHYGSLRSQWNITTNQQFDAWLRGSASLEQPNAPYLGMVKVPGYVTLDLRYAYRMNKDLELSVTGRNLIGARRFEYIGDYVPSIPVEIRPSLLLGLRLGF